MFVLRPIASTDLDDLVDLARELDSMNLPEDRDVLRERIARSERSFAVDAASPSAAFEATGEVPTYLFALEDLEEGRVVGTSMVKAKHGVAGEPYYWLEVSTEERRSVELDKRFTHTKLRLCSTEDGPTEIGGIVLAPRFRGHPRKLGKALSVVRFAFMSLHPGRFEREVIAEMLPPFERAGEHPLWDAFGQHFTGMDYREADHLSAHNKSFIADLFPREAVYATLFPEEVQRWIGEPGESSKAALRILEKIGFHSLNQVDPFDAGPYYGAARDAIRSVRERRSLVLPTATRDDEDDLRAGEELALLSAEGPAGFRATLVPLDDDAAPRVSKRIREALGVDSGEPVQVTPLP